MTAVPERVAALYCHVAIGAALGGGLRALVSVLAGTPGDAVVFPWATLAVNVAGSLLIGAWAALTGPDGPLTLTTTPLQRQFVMTGFCGGLTTFSIFSLETLWLLQAGHGMLAAANVGASVVTCLLAVWAGFVLGRSPALRSAR